MLERFRFIRRAYKSVKQDTLINYLRLTKQPLGYLLNFGKAGGLDFKRIILSEFLPQ